MVLLRQLLHLNGGDKSGATARGRARMVAARCWVKFAWGRPLFIGVLDGIVDGKNPEHFPSLNLTLSHKDLEEIEKWAESVSVTIQISGLRSD
jgi:hypothetical protein